MKIYIDFLLIALAALAAIFYFHSLVAFSVICTVFYAARAVDKLFEYIADRL